MRALFPAARGEHQGWTVIVAYAAPQNFVNGTTTLMSFTDLGSYYARLAFVLVVESGAANSADAVEEVSHGGVEPNDEMKITKTCAAGREVRIDREAPNPDTYHRFSVENAGVTVQGRWALLGVRR